MSIIPNKRDVIVDNDAKSTFLVNDKNFYANGVLDNNNGTTLSSSENIIATIDEALKPYGEESRKLILHCIRHKYGLDSALLARYKEEFGHYLCEIIGNQAAEVILSKVKQDNVSNLKIVESKSSLIIADSLKKKEADRRRRISDKVYFVICDSCFWCASYLKPIPASSSTMQCASCGYNIESAIPIALDESMRLGECASEKTMIWYFYH